MQLNKNNKKIINYTLIILSLFMIVLFTKDLILDTQWNTIKIQEKKSEETEKRQEVKKLKALKKQTDLQLEKYTKQVQENELVEYLYSTIEKLNTSRSAAGSVFVKSLKISKGTKNEIWFLESSIDLTVQIWSEIKMKQLLDTLLSETSDYKFFIPSFSYEKPDSNVPDAVAAWRWETESFEVNIPLKIFYK